MVFEYHGGASQADFLGYLQAMPLERISATIKWYHYIFSSGSDVTEGYSIGGDKE
ncbi:MAG: hypothetical protein ACLTDC_02780 [Lachnospiraceae bacterium]